MINLDIYTIITLLFAVALAIMGVEILLKHIPQNEAFAKLRIMKFLVASMYLITASFAAVEFMFWDRYQFETATFLNLAALIYQFEFGSAIITTYINPSFTSMRRVLAWLGLTTAWVIPLGVCNYLQLPWTVYAVVGIFLLQMGVSSFLFHKRYKDSLTLLSSTDTEHKLHLNRLNFGTRFLYLYCLCFFVITWLPPVVHNIFTTLAILTYTFFAARFNSFTERLYREYYPVLTEAGLTDIEPEVTDVYLQREAHCREAVEAWTARKGFCLPDPDRDAAAEQIGLERGDLQWYFSVCLKTEFRSWRVKLRIEEAKNILLANPDAPINELARSLGFSSRTNFFAHFKKIMGVTTQEFIASHRLKA